MLNSLGGDKDVSPVGELGNEGSGVLCKRVKCHAVQSVEYDLDGEAILATVTMSKNVLEPT